MAQKPRGRSPPPPYRSTIAGGNTLDSASGSNYVWTPRGANGFGSNAGSTVDYSSRPGVNNVGQRRRASEEATAEMLQRLQSPSGVKVCSSSRTDMLRATLLLECSLFPVRCSSTLSLPPLGDDKIRLSSRHQTDHTRLGGQRTNLFLALSFSSLAWRMQLLLMTNVPILLCLEYSIYFSTSSR